MYKKKFYEAAKIKRISPGLDEIESDCGYEKKFRYNIDMNSNGIMAECIQWCQVNCEGKWGWWFEQKRDASRFWLAVGVQNMGNND